MNQEKTTTKYLGSSLDEFLAEEGFLFEVTAVAQELVIEAVLQRSYAAQKGGQNKQKSQIEQS